MCLNGIELNIETGRLTSFVDVKAKYDLIIARLTFLRLKKEELRVKYLDIHSPKFDEEPSHSSLDRNKVIAYLDSVERRGENGLSINEEINVLEDEARRLRTYLMNISRIIKSLGEVEGELFQYIYLEGKKPSWAVTKVSRERWIAESTIWRKYYKNMKEHLE